MSSKIKLREELTNQKNNGINTVKTVVVKVGSRILTDKGHEERVPKLVSDLCALTKSGMRVVLVSSGAIARGMGALGLKKRPPEIPMQQACASIGQNRLMGMYQSYFEKHNTIIGQVLLTWDDLRSKKRYLNLRNTLFKLLDCGAIPIINENDSVGIEEIQFGNNDMLGAQIALLANADVFVNLTDVGGLFDKNPRAASDAKHIPIVETVSRGVQRLAADKKNDISVGGMSTKLMAADMVTKAGIYALIGDGYTNSLQTVMSDPAVSTLFLPCIHRMSSRQRYIAFASQTKGSVKVDDGAATAVVRKNKSLLAAGIVSVSGKFKSGDMVDVVDAKNKIIARGLINFDANEVEQICGCKTSDIEKKLGHKLRYNEVMLRDNLVLMGE